MNPDRSHINKRLEISKRGGNTQPLITRSSECVNVLRHQPEESGSERFTVHQSGWYADERDTSDETNTLLTLRNASSDSAADAGVRARNGTRRGSASQNITASFNKEHCRLTRPSCY